MTDIKWFFFDLGSTLVDETEADLHRIREMISGTDIALETYCEKHMEMIKQGLPGDLAAIDFFGLKKTAWHNEDEKPYQDAIPTLAALKRNGFKLGVIANQNTGTVDRLAQWDMLEYFDVIASSAELGVAKPDHQIFQWALDKAKCLAEEAAMVGDRLDNDMAPANQLGMQTVRIMRGLGAYHEPQTKDELPDYTIEKLSDVLSIWS